MTDIYVQHDAAFPLVSAFAIVKGGKQFGKVAFKFPRDGAGRLWCYFHLHGMPMFRGYAGGYGYDKKSAAAANAFQKIYEHWEKNIDPVFKECWARDIKRMAKAMEKADSGHWDSELRRLGFQLYQAV